MRNLFNAGVSTITCTVALDSQKRGVLILTHTHEFYSWDVLLHLQPQGRDFSLFRTAPRAEASFHMNLRTINETIQPLQVFQLHLHQTSDLMSIAKQNSMLSIGRGII